MGRIRGISFHSWSVDLQACDKTNTKDGNGSTIGELWPVNGTQKYCYESIYAEFPYSLRNNYGRKGDISRFRNHSSPQFGYRDFFLGDTRNSLLDAN